jgi:hypothetical protein
MNQKEGKPTDADAKRKTDQPQSLKSAPLKPIEAPTKEINGSAGKKQCTEKQKSNWPTRIEAACAVVLVFITGFYTYYARQQAGAARETLIASQRPWVDISADHPITVERLQTVTESVSPDLQQIVAMKPDVSFTLENFGNSPAIKIAPFDFEAVPTDEAEVPENWSNMECAHSEERSKGGSGTITLMAKSFIARKTNPIIQIPKGMMIRVLPAEPMRPAQRYVHHIWLLGCIAYQDTLSGTNGAIHRTRVVLHSDYIPGVKFQFRHWESDGD